MIGYLKGIILSKSLFTMLLDVHDVGYKVQVSQDILQQGHVGQEIAVYIHTHVREDSLELYGFADEVSLSLFEQLISVNGIGPKTAIGIFALGKKEEIFHAITSADVDFFTGVPRLGRKNAQKLIIELKNKLGSVEELDLKEEDTDIVNALMQFGFSSDEARRAVRSLSNTEATMEEKIKLALKHLGK